MKPLFQTVALWASLAGTSCLLTLGARADALQYLIMAGIFVLPALAVWLTMQAAPSQGQRWFSRGGFWAVTLAGWGAMLLIAQGWWEVSGTLEPERRNFMIGFGLASVVAVWLAAKNRAFARWSILRDVTAGFAVLAITAGLFVLGYDANTRALAGKAEARWTEIGRSMEDFEKTLTVSKESAGSEVARQTLREFALSRFYMEGSAAARREPPVEYSEADESRFSLAASWGGYNGGTSDVFEVPKDRTAPYRESIAAIEPIGLALDGAYRRILAVEAPAWSANPADGYNIDEPNFLGIRKFCQLAAADSARRLTVGDDEGAARALAAAHRFTQKLAEHPTIVSLMIQVATDAVLTPQTVRIPATDDALQSLAEDISTKREKLLRCLQFEALTLLRTGGRELGEKYSFDGPPKSYLPNWTNRAFNFAAERYWKRECYRSALHNAEHVAILSSPTTIAQPDMGIKLQDEFEAKNPSFAAQTLRTWTRLHAVLLLREQTELIRLARARLAAGLPVESRDSIVFPSSRWELVGDPQKNTVTTRLVNSPEFIVTNVVTAKDFWLLPIDGSAAWQFRPPARTASTRR